jgi:hypothetical protein
MHSKTPYILRENINLTQIEFSVKEVQKNRKDDNIPLNFESSDESEYFDSVVLPEFQKSDIQVIDYTID